MTVSRADRLAAVVVLALAAGAMPATAQPIQLNPRPAAPAVENEAAASDHAPGPGAGADVVAPAPAPAAPARDRKPLHAPVEVDSLAAIDPNAVGVLDEREGGYGVDMWSGTKRALVHRLLPALPAATPSRTMRSMMERLLLSVAAVPEGPIPAGDSLLLLRVERLMAMGNVDGALALIEAAPKPAITGKLLRHRVDALLLRGATASACAEVDQMMAGGDEDGYLTKVQAFCNALAGRLPEANLAVEWLREQGHGDAAFFAIFDMLAGLPATELSSLPHPRPLHLAMLKAASKPLPEDAATGNDPAVLRAVALAVNAPLETRLLAAEKAEYVGALDTAVLRELYAGTTFTDAELAEPLAKAASDAGARSRALLFRAAHQQQAPTARAEIIGRALSLARQHGHYFSAARLFAPLVAEMRPAPDLAGFAGEAARALLAAGRLDAAAPWVRLANATREGSPLWPLIRLVEPQEDQPIEPALLVRWLKQRAPLPPDQAARQAAVVFGLLDALGDRIGTEEWLPLLDGPPLVSTTMPQPALWHVQRIAAEDLRSAETVLIALVSLGEGGPGATEPTSLYRIIASLRLVGFDAEARALALEAALANGV